MHLDAKAWEQPVHNKFDSGQTNFPKEKGTFADDCIFLNIFFYLSHLGYLSEKQEIAKKRTLSY